MERRLAAILAADVANYSLLMNTDEGATYTAWRAARNEVVDPRIAQFNGRIVKHTGDGFLAEFPTVLSAVECAVGVQTEMSERNTHIAGDRPFQFRIGINLGDIIADDEDIHGDGVNIAARLESICTLGGVCISADVYRQIANKPGFHIHDMGEHRVKNIRAPIQAYAITRGEAGIVAPLPEPVSTTQPELTEPSITDVLNAISTPAHSLTSQVVGRERELEILSEAYTQATRQNGNIVLIRGEPGIGKSCLSHWFCGQVQSADTQIVFGQCHETLGSPPFWPWLQVLKALHGSGEFGTSTSANIFESLTAGQSAQTGKTVSTFSGDTGSEQFLLFNRITNLLAEYATQRCLVIMLDDLHWADRSSLLLLSHLCRKLSDHSILVIGTYRDREITRKHPLFEQLGIISRESKLQRISLRGLSPQAVSSLLRSDVDHVLPDELLKRLYEKTEGNPLFVTEVAGLLQQELPRFAEGQLALEIPDGIQEAIGRRLNLLSNDCTDLLSLASVVGRRFSLRILSALRPEDNKMHTLQLLEEATGRDILRESDDKVGEFHFSHVLIRDMIYEELSLTKKLLWHSQVADVLVNLQTQGSPQSLGEIARHYYQALQNDQGDKALDYALRAGEHAYRLAAFDEALAYYELALDVVNTDNKGAETDKTQILLGIANCLHATGAGHRDTFRALDRCLAEAREHQHHNIFAEAACRKIYQVRDPKLVQDALTTIEEALNHIDPNDLVIHATTIAHRAMALSYSSRRREAEQDANMAVELATKSGDQHSHCNALCMALLVLRGRPEKLSERIRIGEQALQIALAAGDTFLGMDPLEWLILTYQELGDIDRARHLVTLLHESARETHRFKPHYFAKSASACLELFSGNWQLAETLIEEAIDLGSGALDGGADGVYGTQMFLLNRELGRLPMIQSALKQMVSEHTPMWKPGLLATYTDLGLLDETRTLFDELNGSDITDDELLLTRLVYLSEACVAIDESDKAARLFQRLLPYSGQMVSHPTAVCFGPADLYLGMLASLMNKLDDAEELLKRAAVLSRQAGVNMWQPHIAYRHAQVLKRHNYRGGKPAFRKLLEESHSTASALGMVNLIGKIKQLESDTSGETRDNLHGLTHRELEVLNLIAQGKSNKLIAADLNRSLATVATHVRAILNKTHTANRTEAAAFAIENELCDP